MKEINATRHSQHAQDTQSIFKKHPELEARFKSMEQENQKLALQLDTLNRIQKKYAAGLDWALNSRVSMCSPVERNDGSHVADSAT